MHFGNGLALVMAVVTGSNCLGQCGPQFIPGDQLPGVTAGMNPGNVHAALEWDFDGAGPQPSKLIVAGAFTEAGGLPASNLALWDGSLWGPFGTGANGAIARVAAHNGEVISVGSFTTIGGVSTPSGLAAFDGTAWRGLPMPGASTGGAIKQILSHGGLLYACGAFTFDGVPGNYIAAFDGTTWAPLGAPFDGPINDIALYNGELIAGGAFTTSGSDEAFCIAKWNGAHWLTFNGGTSDAVNCIRQFGTSLYVGGVFTGAGSPIVSTPRLAKWSGSAWSAVTPSTVFSQVHSLGGTATTFAAGGTSPFGGATMKYAVLVSGEPMPPSSAEVGGGNDSEIAWIGGYQGRLHLAGTYQNKPANSGDILHMSISRVIDGRWHALTGGLNGRIKSIAVYNGQVFGVGDFTRWKNTPISKIATWNGTDWVQFNTAYPNPTETPAVVKSWNSRLYIIGESVNNLQAFWNGTAWSGWENGVNSPQLFVEFVGNRLMAGTEIGWRQVTAPLPDIYAAVFNGPVKTSIPYGNGYMIGGRFSSAGGTAVQNVATSNGTTWSAVGQGLTTGPGLLVNKLLNIDGVPHAFGSFVASGSTQLHGVARWNGAAWEPLGNAPFDIPFTSISDAAAHDGKIYVVGNFTYTDSTWGLMQYDGVSWSSRGGLPSERPFGPGGGRAITIVGDELWITGQFAYAGGVPSYQFARYRLTTPAPHIDSPPAAVNAHRGEPALFEIAASGSGTLTYEWRRNGVSLGAPSSPSFAIAAIADSNRGLYDCVVSDGCGIETTSAGARLTVLTADLGIQSGSPGTDGVWNNNDFIAFIALFFSQDPAADLGQQGGIPGGDGGWDNNDFIVFINLFFGAV